MAIRVLIVDDSVVIRRMLASTLTEVPGIEVVATAALGTIALAKLAQCSPDVVILDVEMPEMDGIETLRRIRKEAPRLPVIMFSSKTERGAAATIEALTSGASDYVPKPAGAGNPVAAMARVREEMVPKIRALAAGGRPALGRPLPEAFDTATSKSTPIALPLGSAARRSEATRRSTTANPALGTDAPIPLHRSIGSRPLIEIVAIGASTGGPNALSTILAELPAAFPVPIVIVQHMLATFTRHFAERLATQCRIKIVEASEGDVLAPGHAYVARGDFHLVAHRQLGRATLAMNQERAENFCRPAVDVLFRSVAHSFGASALAVVLTGMGHDGLVGCGAIREAGGDVIVQDEQSSVVWGMPGFVARAGLASQVLPLDQVAGELRRRAPGARVGAAP